MSGVTVVALAALLGAILLVVVAAMVWQESRRRPSREPTEFVIEDAATHVHTELAAAGLERDMVLGVVEWHMQWVTDNVAAGQPGVIGLSAEAAHYILERQPQLERDDVERILDGVSRYVASLGAVGPAF